MAIVVKLLLYTGTDHPNITHEDQEVYGLRFRIIRIEAARQFMVVKGDDAQITAYLGRNPNITLTNLATLANAVLSEQPTVTCMVCQGTGKLANSQYLLNNNIPVL